MPGQWDPAQAPSYGMPKQLLPIIHYVMHHKMEADIHDIGVVDSLETGHWDRKIFGASLFWLAVSLYPANATKRCP